MDTELGLDAGTGAAPRADLAVTDDDDRVGQRRGGLAPLRGVDVRHGDLRGRGQRGDGCNRLLGGRRGDGGLGLGAQGTQVDGGVQAARQVGIHRGGGCLRAYLSARQLQQLLGHLLGRPGANTRGLDGGDHRVVATHEAGAAHPTDTRVSDRDARTPDRLGCPAGRDGIEGCLRLGVRAVAAEDAAVGGTGQYDVQAVVGVRVGTDRAQAGDGTLDAPQQQAHLVLRGRARVGQRAGDARSSEGVEERWDQGFLGHLHVGAHGLGLLGADPLHERVHVAVGGQVRGNQPQLRTARGVRAVELLGESQARGGNRRGGRDDRRATGEQAADDRATDGGGSHAGDHGDVVRVGQVLGRRQCIGRDLLEASGSVVIALGTQAVRPVRGLLGHGAAGAHEGRALGEGTFGDVACDVLTGRGPAVVQQDGARGVEARLDQVDPTRTQLGGDSVDDASVVGGVLAGGGGGVQTQLGQDCASGLGQDTVLTGHGRSVGIQRGGVNDAATGRATGAGQGHCNTLTGRDGGHGSIDEGIDAGGVRRGIQGQGRQVAVTGRGALTGAQDDLGGDVLGPPGSQLPRAGDAVGDVAGLDAGGAEQLARALLDGLGQDRTEGLVALGGLVDRRGQRGHVGLAGAIDRVQAQLGGHVHEQLVTTRGHAVGQRLGRVGRADLVDADLRGQGQQGDDGRGSREGQVCDVGTRRTAGRCCGGGSRSCLGRRSRGCGGRSCLGGGGCRGDLLVLLVLDHGDVGRVDARLVALDVEDVDARERELGGEQGAGGQVGQGRGGTEAHLDDLIDAQAGNAGGSLFSRKQHALRLDPAHRGGELPAQQLNEERAGQDTRVGQGRVPRAFRLEQLAHRVGGNHVEDGLGELAGELEGTRHQVGDVAAHELRGIDLGGDTFIELRTEVRYAAAQDSGVEGHVNAGNVHEGTLATVLGGALGGVLLEGLQARDRTGNGVLLARQVEVDDLEELTRCLSDRLDVLHDVSVVDAELVRTQGAHAVVRTALLVAGHERVHRGTALEDQVDDDLEREDLGVCRQRVVLAQRVTGEGSTRNQHALFAHAGRLANRQGRERNLRELGEVQDAFGVTVGHAARHDLGRVVAHDRQDGEAHRRAGVCIGAAPDLVHGLGLGALVQAHAGALDALAGVDVGDLRGEGVGRRARDDLLVDAAGDLEGQAATDDAAHALDGDLNLVVQVDGAVHVVRPAGDLSAALASDAGLGRVLSGGRQPHAVHQRGVHAGDLGGRVGGVDRVVVARDDRKRRHVVGSLDAYATQDRARCVHDLDVCTAEGRGLGGRAVAGGAATDREALLGGTHVLAVRGQLEGDGDDTARGGLVDGGHVAGDVDRGDAAFEHLLGRVFQGDRVVEVDGVEQALNNRVVVVDGRPQGRVDGGPGGAEQGVRCPGGQLVAGGQGGARGLGVVEAQGGGQREGVVGLAED